jgi:hypothetical protein
MLHAAVRHPPTARGEAEDAMGLACDQYWTTNCEIYNSNHQLFPMAIFLPINKLSNCTVSHTCAILTKKGMAGSLLIHKQSSTSSNSQLKP